MDEPVSLEAVLFAEAAALDRRIAERCPCERLRPARLLVRPHFQPYPVRIRDLSRRGIGLVFTRRFDAGTLLALQLRSRHVGVSDILTAEVRHATPLAHGYWALGCRLSRNLTEEERRAFQEFMATRTPVGARPPQACPSPPGPLGAGEARVQASEAQSGEPPASA